VDADHQRRAAVVAEPRPFAVAAAIAGAVAGHRHAVPAGEQLRPRAAGNRERHRRLAGGAAGILDLQLARAWANRLNLAADLRRRAVTRVEADERCGGDLGQHR